MAGCHAQLAAYGGDQPVVALGEVEQHLLVEIEQLQAVAAGEIRPNPNDVTKNLFRAILVSPSIEIAAINA
jgi:hypothetical protein